MMQILLKRGNNIVLLLILILFFSCEKGNSIEDKEYYYPKMIIDSCLREEVLLFRDYLDKVEATNKRVISICVFQKKDSVFIELGDYQPNFKMIDIIGVELINNDTVYLYNKDEKINVSRFYKVQSEEKIRIIDDSERVFEFYDPNYRCFYVDKCKTKKNSYRMCR